MKPLVIFGCGPIGELAHYYFTRDGGRAVIGFSVDCRLSARGKVLRPPGRPI